MILREDKDLELRHQRLTPGRYYLASGRVVQGVADVGVAFEVEDDFWFRSLLHRHQLDTASKPYKKTWAHPLTGVQRMDPSVPYALVQGQQGTARFRPMHEGGERSVWFSWSGETLVGRDSTCSFDRIFAREAWTEDV